MASRKHVHLHWRSLVSLVGSLGVVGAANAQCLTPGWQPGYRRPGIGQNVYRMGSGSLSNRECFVASGVFSFVIDNGINCIHLGLWDGQTWKTLGGGLDNDAVAFEPQPDGSLIVGGGFRNANGGTELNGIGRWDGAAWSPLGGGVSSRGWGGGVGRIATLHNGDLVAAGSFDHAGSVAAHFIATWDGADWHAMGPPGVDGLNGYALDLAVLPNGDLVAAGEFTLAGGRLVNNIARWDGAEWWPLGEGVTGAVDTSPVLTLAVMPNGDLVAGGNLVSAGGRPVNGLAKWNGSTWSALAAGLEGGAVNAMAVIPDSQGGAQLLAGGTFTTSGGRAMTRLALWDGSTWYALGAGADLEVRSLVALSQRRVAVGGFFYHIDRIAFDEIAIGDIAEPPFPPVGIARWSGVGDGLNAPPEAIAVLQDGSVLVGGSFTSAGGVRMGPIARWNGPGLAGRHWSPENVPISSATIHAMTVLPNGDLVIGGRFRLNGTSCLDIAKRSGGVWTPLGIGLNSDVRCICADADGALVVGGSFTTGDGVAASRVARWDGQSWRGLGAGVNGDVYAIERLANGDLVAAGTFTASAGAPVNRIARWTGSAWAPLGAGFNGSVWALRTLPNGDLVAGGAFTASGGTPLARIARWDGSAWTGMGAGMTADFGDASVRALTLREDGQLIATGTFDYAGGVHAYGVARWNGSAWESYNLGVSGLPGAVAVLPGGDLLVGGGGFAQEGDYAYMSTYFAHRTSGESPRITRQPSDQNGCPASRVSFSTTAFGAANLAFRWQSNRTGVWADLADGGIAGLGSVAGSRTAAVSIDLVPGAAGVRLRCTVSNSCGSAVTNEAVVLACGADYNCDGFVDFFDYSDFVACFVSDLCPAGETADFNGDGFVDFFDYSDFVDAFESGC